MDGLKAPEGSPILVEGGVGGDCLSGRTEGILIDPPGRSFL